jgi:glutathione S-transferase
MNIRLIYFDTPFWRAETSRIALHLGGIPFEDERMSHDQFRVLKATGKLPYGQLPVLEVDGAVIAQSLAIARFCGRQSGLYPAENLVDAARVDEILDTASQITELFHPSMREEDREKRAAMRQELATQTAPRWLDFLEKRLLSSGKTHYFVGGQLTIADLAIWRLLGWILGGYLDGIPTDLIKAQPGLTAHFQSIDQHSGVRLWMDQHYPSGL